MTTTDARPLANLTAQQFSDYCGAVDADALSGGADETAIAVGEICVAEVNARKARHTVAYRAGGRYIETGNHPDREPAQKHADRLNAADQRASASVIEYPW